VDTAEALGRVAAGEEGAQLALDVSGQTAAAVLVLEAGEEGLEVLADEGVERCGGRVAAQQLRVLGLQGLGRA
jgi:hypothetical protein